jgi:hypothetical protein
MIKVKAPFKANFKLNSKRNGEIIAALLYNYYAIREIVKVHFCLIEPARFWKGLSRRSI